MVDVNWPRERQQDIHVQEPDHLRFPEELGEFQVLVPHRLLYVIRTETFCVFRDIENGETIFHLELW
jgi:hypothetical protein